MLGISSFIRQDFPQFSGQAGTAAPAVRYLTERTDWLADRVIETGHRGKPVLLVTGDSFMNELLPFLYPHFSRIVFAHNGNAYFRPDLIDAYNPQVVLLEVHEPQLRLAMSIGATDLQLRKTDRVRVHTDPSELGACSVDSIAVGPNDQGRPMIEARGWVADAQGGRVAPTATLVLQSSTSTYQASIQVNLDRTDVADYFKQPGLARSGFYLMGDAAGLEPGAYAVYLLQQYGADTLMCVTPKRIELPATK